MSWITPVFDRTQYDIEEKTEKAFLNVSDRNRIENNMSELAALLGASVSTRTWSYDDIPSTSHDERWIGNINALKAAWVFPGLPETPSSPLNTYQKINDIELILERIKTNRETTTFARCGELYAGETAFLI